MSMLSFDKPNSNKPKYITNFTDYARRVCEIKKIQCSKKTLQMTEEALIKAHETIYKAVAFDVDGTLTLPNSTTIDVDMANTIGNLLRRGVHVLLITGRGRTTTRDAARQIIQKAKLSDAYSRRLQAVTHNGIYWLYTQSDRPDLFLQEEKIIAPEFPNIHHLKQIIIQHKKISSMILNEEIKIMEEPSSKTRALRLILNPKANLEPNDLLSILQRLIKSQNFEEEIYISRGAYGNLVSFDITSTNKTASLKYYADHLGTELDCILRIGDQGNEDGNDFELLNHHCGFSVGTVSSNPESCFPAIDEKTLEQLFGADATISILSRLQLFPPLTLLPSDDTKMLKALHNFQKVAMKRTKQESFMLLERLRVRLHRLLGPTSGTFEATQIDFDDLFDPLSGGVKLQDWELGELDDVPSNQLALDLFGLSDDIFHNYSDAILEWSMLTDKFILLRGPKYYWALTNDTESRGYLEKYSLDCISFVSKAQKAIASLLEVPPNWGSFKLLLGIMDNIRNISLSFQYAIYISEIYRNLNELDSNFSITRKYYDSWLRPHFDLHYHTLLNANYRWDRILNDYADLIQKLPKHLTQITDFALPYELKMLEENQKAFQLNETKPWKSLVRKWRECDNFLENLLAVEIGLHELEDLIVATRQKEDKTVVAIGLVYGGLELPIITDLLSTEKGYFLETGFMNISLYGNAKIRKQVQNDGISPLMLVKAHEQSLESLVLLKKKDDNHLHPIYDKKVILLDDNCTTARTLQVARDLLLQNWADVIGAIIVRYPATNRIVQMKMPNHGLPDPDVLLSFIRGLVSPSPYTRLMTMQMEKDNPYLDKTGIFDKSRSRIERYLDKHG